MESYRVNDVFELACRRRDVSMVFGFARFGDTFDLIAYGLKQER